MADPIGLSATRMDIFTKSYLAQSAIPEGAVVIHYVAGTDDEVILPAAANAKLIAGVSVSAGTATAGTDRIAVQKLGQAPVLLGAGLSVVVGDELVIANSSGHVKKRQAGDADSQVIGVSEVTFTAGSNADLISAFLCIGRREVQTTFVGSATNALAASTQYLGAPGTHATTLPIAIGIAGRAGVLGELYVNCSTLAGGSDHCSFTVVKSSDNGATLVSTTLTCNLGAAVYATSDTTNWPAVAAGDVLYIATNSSGTTIKGITAQFKVLA